MTWKKNGYSCFIWLVYTVAVSFGLFCVVSCFAGAWGYTLPVTISGTIFVLWFACGITYLLYRLNERMGEWLRNQKPLSLTLEVVCTLSVIGLGAWFAFSEPINEAGNAYFQFASVQEGQDVPALLHGAEYLYVQLLHIVCIFLGNDPYYCIITQMILYLLAAVLFSISVRRIAGVLSSVITLVFMAFSLPLCGECRTLSPNVLYLLLLSAVLHLVISCMKTQDKGILLSIVAGICIGLLLYLDVTGAILLLVFAGILYSPKQTRLFLYVVGILAAAVGFIACVLVDSLFTGKAFFSVLQAWGCLYMPSAFRIPVSVMEDIGNLDVFLLFVGLTLGIFSFFCSRRQERLSVFVLPLIGLMTAQGFGMLTKQMDGSFFIYLFVTVLCAIGIGNIFTVEKSGEEEGVPETLTIQDLDADDAQNVVEEPVEVEAEVPAVSAEETVPVQYIENPLPLPKKHVPRVLDYDIEVPDDDDYDI